MSIQVGDRVRLTQTFGHQWPAGMTGVVTKCLPYGAIEVAFDVGVTTFCTPDTLEVYVPQFASHYQAQPIQCDTDDDHDYTPAPKDKALSGDELMNITRSFCR